MVLLRWNSAPSAKEIYDPFFSKESLLAADEGANLAKNNCWTITT